MGVIARREGEYRAQAIQVLDMLADKAERHLRAALTCVKTLPPWQQGVDRMLAEIL